MSKNYLIHHGIKGQRWGVRRFQNEDGTYTAAGKKRREQLRAKTGDGVSKDMKEIERRTGLDRYGGSEDNPNSDKINGVMWEYGDKYNKMFNEFIQTTPEYKKFKAAEDKLNSYNRNNPFTAGKWKRARQEYYDANKAVMAVISDSSRTSELDKKVKKLKEEYKNKWASTVLDAAGYENTKEARDYINNLYDFDKIQSYQNAW
jgi:hypothetical protein